MVLRSALLALACGMISACSSPGANLAPIDTANSQPYRLGTGDGVRVTVFGLEALSNSYLVGDGGMISVPLIGPVPAQGKTVAELETSVADALRSKNVLKDPSVSVQVDTYRPFFVLGEVQRPGQYPYVPGMTLVTAVSIAGGYTFRAETDYASVTRTTGGDAREGKAERLTPILPGDTVYIYESWF